MGVDFKVLRDAIRKPMLSWWLRYGVWWVGAAAGLEMFHLFARSYFYSILSSTDQGSLPWHFWIWSGSEHVASLLFAVAWLLAAIHCRKLITGFLEDTQAPGQAGYTPLLFRLAYCQGLFLVVLVWLIHFSNEITFQIRSASTYPNQNNWLAMLDLFSTAIHAALPLAISMIWLTGLLTLLPRRTWPAWGLLGANFSIIVVELIAGLMIDRESYVFPLPSADFLQWYSASLSWGKLIGAAVIIGMFLLFRARMAKPAWVLYGLLAGCIANLLLYPMYLISNLSEGYRRLSYLPFYIGGAYNHGPSFSIYEWVSAMQQLRLSQGTVLVHLIPLLPTIVSVLWPVAMYALMYYVLLRPAREVGVTLE